MQVTFPGFFLLPLGFILFLASPRYLYYFTIFFIPFSATSVLNSESGAALLAAQYLGSLLILRKCLEIILAGKIPLLARFSEDKSFFLMLLFATIVVSTMVMPAIIDGRVLVNTMRLPNLEEVPLYLTSKNFKNPLPVIFGMALAYVIATRNSTPERVVTTLRVYMCSAVFVSFWGIMQSLLFSLDIPFPYFIFNSTVHESVIEIGTTIDLGEANILRVASVTLEPSLFAQFLLTAVPVYILASVGNVVIFSKVLDRAMIVVIMSGLLIATSASAYLGLLIVAVAVLAVGHLTGLLRIRNYVVAATSISVLGYLIYQLVPAVSSYLSEIIFEKPNTGSAFERLFSIATAWGYFLDYPMLGLGWGTVTSHDLLVCLLANSGIIGLASFLALIVYVTFRSVHFANSLRATLRTSDKTLTVFSCGLNTSLIAHLGISLFTEFTYYLPHLYFLLGMVVATNICAQKRLGPLTTRPQVG
jgi:hypothetical protein